MWLFEKSLCDFQFFHGYYREYIWIDSEPRFMNLQAFKLCDNDEVAGILPFILPILTYCNDEQ